MKGGDAAFLEALRATFKIEAAEHSQSIATGLVDLERTPTPEAQTGLIATVFRAAHSLKGAARAVDFGEVESSCQLLEDLFAGWKDQEGRPMPAAFDTAHRTLDSITEALGARQPDAALPSLPRQSLAAPAAPTAPVAALEDTVRITIAKLDARLMEAEEMLTAKLTTGQRAKDLRELGQRFRVWQEEWTVVEPVARALGQVVDGHAVVAGNPGLGRLLEFVEWNRDQLRGLEAGVAALARTAQQDHHAIGKLVDDLLEDSKKLLLLPFATLAAPFPKMVRDLCRDLGKEADLVIQGEDVEIDKRILEEMKDPLIHLLRNCVDHGVEGPDVRVRAGKPRRATIVLEVMQVEGSKVQISVTDDGAGIDVGKVKKSAIKHGFLSESDATSRDDAAARDLIFHADVSTSPMITRLSGRGLGMAIVREQAEKLGGTVTVTSRAGEGSRFCIVLPLMLATFRGVLIEVAGGLFVVPTAHVERVVRVKVD
ncbi:MAG: ATP-binding protein, partial [Alphaproteobacteria bacterium]|nr:ATP-binding protein [Alphaproteobacteria bacterium]